MRRDDRFRTRCLLSLEPGQGPDDGQIGQARDVLADRGQVDMGQPGEMAVVEADEISYPAIARVLAELDYDGTVAMEAWAAEDSDLALERFRAAFTPVTLSTVTPGAPSTPGPPHPYRK